MITLPTDIEQAVLRYVAAGSYATEAEVLRAAMAALSSLESDLAAVDEGLEDVKQGRIYPVTEAFDRVSSELFGRNAQ